MRHPQAPNSLLAPEVREVHEGAPAGIAEPHAKRSPLTELPGAFFADVTQATISKTIHEAKFKSMQPNTTPDSPLSAALSPKLVQGLAALTPQQREQAIKVAAKLLALRAKRESMGQPIDLTQKTAV